MKLHVQIDIAEAAAILREHLAAKLGQVIGTVTIASYDKARITFWEDGLVESTEIRHRITE